MPDIMLDNRSAQILIIAKQREYNSLDFLADMLEVGTRTVRNCIKALNIELEGIASLENERGKGYHLVIENEEAFKAVMHQLTSGKNTIDSSKQRIAFIIERLIENNQTYTLDELAFEMNIGRTTLVNELKKASVSLNAYNLKIHGKQNTGLQLIGDELDLRFFILENAYELLYGSYPLDKDVVDEVTRIATKYDFESASQKRLLEFVIVMLDCLLKNRSLSKVNENLRKLSHTSDYQIGREIAKALEDKLPVHIPENEILFLTVPIAGRRTPTNKRTTTKIKITDEVKELLELIFEQIGFNKRIIEENPCFIEDLQYHLSFMLNRLMFGLRLNNPMLADVKSKYPVAYNMAKIAGQVIENEYELEVSEDELGYLAFYFEVFISQSELKMKKIKKAAVVCGTGRGTAKLVTNQLERVLNDNVELDIYSERDVTEAILNAYDIVFSTVTLEVDTDSSIIMINEIFDEHRVAKKIDEVAYMRRFNAKADNPKPSILSHLISKDKFFKLDGKKGYHQNLYDMVDELVEKKYLDSGFKQRLKERELKGSMVFDNFIALPHTSHECSDNIELALGIFPEKVISAGKEIKLIFLLGLPIKQNDAIENQLVSVYDEIIRLANNDQLIADISSTAAYGELSQLLKKVSKFY
ncbi:BglG family transcription antiterminator [Salipaludibacillus agaradhaerens]|uniref:BglG family transcription antiterminator n=1 Tax=Salipaludibacillus agaradhaerens TaxID=76935 RepID=UPI000998C1BB|nr:BglG family transcription antiterminator [Salipaludibacillus agaradhaerens]